MTLQTTSSQPLMLLRAVVVYDLPNWTVSQCFAVDSALSAVGRSTTTAGQTYYYYYYYYYSTK